MFSSERGAKQDHYRLAPLAVLLLFRAAQNKPGRDHGLRATPGGNHLYEPVSSFLKIPHWHCKLPSLTTLGV